MPNHDIPTTSDLICMDSRAFYAMFTELVDKIKNFNAVQQDPWISTEEAMRLLRITSKTTLRKFCDEGLISFSPLTPKLVLYNYESILGFIEKNAQNQPK